MSEPLDRRKFLYTTAGLGSLAAGASLSFAPGDPLLNLDPDPDEGLDPNRPAYPADKPRVILVRFGGGVRRLETIQDAEHTYCPFVYHELFRRQRGVLFSNVEIESPYPTSHGEGTLYILTGKYARYTDVFNQPLADRYESQVPTLFEYLRRAYQVPEHEALLINGEDRINEEFYTFSNHHQFGVRYRSTVLSLYRFKTFLLRDELANGNLSAQERAHKQNLLRQMASRDYRQANAHVASEKLDEFWRGWREYYGRTGFVNPRGDRLLTTLALRALRELKPKLMMINYQDPDYVHWGNRQFYTRAISIIDEGIREIYNATQAIDEYRNNTVFVVVPDCGRDSNRAMPVPYQHHNSTRSSREIFALFSWPGVGLALQRVGRTLQGGGRVLMVDRRVQQASVAATVGAIMGFDTPETDAGAGVLEDAFT
jgi:hypothetical protein